MARSARGGVARYSGAGWNMKIPDLRLFTSARVSLGRSGTAMPTAELLKLQLAQVRARKAVHSAFNAHQLAGELACVSEDVIVVQSTATDRASYIRRPDLGRRLNDDSLCRLRNRSSRFDVVFCIADGLSAVAVHRHAVHLLEAVFRLLDPSDWRVAPVVLVQQGRVAIADEIGESIGASLSVLLIGERPVLSASDGLGVYVTWNPRAGLTDADRNCISNVRDEGLSYELAAYKLAFLMNESRRRKLSGITLKEDSQAALTKAE